MYLLGRVRPRIPCNRNTSSCGNILSSLGDLCNWKNHTENKPGTKLTCPKGLNPAKAIAEIKKMMVERQG